MKAFLIALLACTLAGCYFFPREEKVPAPPLVAPPATRSWRTPSA